MSRGLIIIVGAVLLALLCWFCIDRHVASIEMDLAARTSQALRDAGEPGVVVALDGRDVTLSGSIVSEEARQRAGAIAAAVYGVRTVRNTLQAPAQATTESEAPVAVEVQPDSEAIQEFETETETEISAAREQPASDELVPEVTPEDAARSCQAQFNTLLEGDAVQFESGAATIKPVSFALLNRISGVAQGCAQARITIAGHTDSSGAAAANKRLSERRAEAVRDYLSDAGIDRERLTSVGYGEEQPKVSNDTPTGRAQNRRVELVVEGV